MRTVTVALAGIILVGGHLAWAEGDGDGNKAERKEPRPEGVAAGHMKDGKARKGRGNEGENRPNRAEMQKRVMERFDKDGDGQLSEQERTMAREMCQRRLREGVGKEGDGQGGKKMREKRERKGGEQRPGKGKGRQGAQETEEAPAVHVEI